MNKANKTIFYKGEKISNNSVKKEWKAFREKSFAEIIIYFGEKIKFHRKKNLHIWFFTKKRRELNLE